MVACLFVAGSLLCGTCDMVVGMKIPPQANVQNYQNIGNQTVGLANPGSQRCWHNSAMQSLFSSNAFVDALLNQRDGNEKLGVLGKFVQTYVNATNGVIENGIAVVNTIPFLAENTMRNFWGGFWCSK